MKAGQVAGMGMGIAVVLCIAPTRTGCHLDTHTHNNMLKEIHVALQGTVKAVKKSLSCLFVK